MATKTIINIALIVLLGLVSNTEANAQKHDKSKFYQIRSMEDGTWNFTPGLYYITLHKSYSGGDWTGFFNIKFKESKSNVKRVATSRIAQVPLEVVTINHLNHQIDSIEPIVKEETIRSAERMVDIVYAQYKDDFTRLGNNIIESLEYTLEKSKGNLIDACNILQRDYDSLCSEIEYIHKQGPGYEIETTKRQLAYEDIKTRLTELAKSCSKLAMVATTQNYK